LDGFFHQALGSVRMSVRVRAAVLMVSLALLSACGAHPTSAVAPSSAVISASPSSPPIPAATDWKGLFDSDSQPGDVPPTPDAEALRVVRETGCARVLTSGNGSFTAQGADETAYLLACDATQRLVVANKHATLASLEVPEDVLETAGDMDLDGDQELLLIGHAGARVTVRALRMDGHQFSAVYTFNMTLEPCTHTIIYYRLLAKGLDFREDKLPKRCSAP
jgi:hypothetical protein